MAKKSENKFDGVMFDLGDDWEVTNVRELEYSTFFTLKMPGLSLYNLRVVPAGKKYDAFIGMPEDKGKDGDYYKRFALYLSEDDIKAVLKAVDKALDKRK